MKFLVAAFTAALASEAKSSPRFLPKFKYTGSIWPHPQQISTSEAVFGVSNYVDIDYDEGSQRCEILTDVFDRYGSLIRGSVGKRFASTHKKLKFENFIENIAVKVSGCEEYPADGMKESYTLNIKSNPDSGPNIHIYAEAEWGVIHALESVTQMIYEQDDGQHVVNETSITDFPRFGFRGFLIDTSRHYLPVSTIKAMISAMSWNRMNVLHWHIVDLGMFSMTHIYES